MNGSSPFDSPAHRRRSIRLKDYDYAEAGAYFLTIAANERRPLFGTVGSDGVVLSETGAMVTNVWESLPERFPYLCLDAFIVMPDHIHGITILTEGRGEACLRPNNEASSSLGDVNWPQSETKSAVPEPGPARQQRTDEGEGKLRPYSNTRARGTAPGSVGRIVQAFKSLSTREYLATLRQRGSDDSYQRLWQRNYYERVIRSDREHSYLYDYIAANPQRWLVRQVRD
ncbi:MAG: hypothetical protein WBW04_15875 [Nitrolancea sp.]